MQSYLTCNRVCVCEKTNNIYSCLVTDINYTFEKCTTFVLKSLDNIPLNEEDAVIWNPHFEYVVNNIRTSLNTLDEKFTLNKTVNNEYWYNCEISKPLINDKQFELYLIFRSNYNLDAQWVVESSYNK